MKIILPGDIYQINYCLKNNKFTDKAVLVLGKISFEIANKIIKKKIRDFIIISNNTDDLTEMRYELKDLNLAVKYMEYSNMDFPDEMFDIVYTQGALSVQEKGEYLKDVKRVLKKDGIFFNGEIVQETEHLPKFVEDIWGRLNIVPIEVEQIKTEYGKYGLEVLDQKEISLESYFKSMHEIILENKGKLEKDLKKLIKEVEHNYYSFVKLGGNKYMKFQVISARRV